MDNIFFVIKCKQTGKYGSILLDLDRNKDTAYMYRTSLVFSDLAMHKLPHVGAFLRLPNGREIEVLEGDF
jgi:hypothetical protein